MKKLVCFLPVFFVFGCGTESSSKKNPTATTTTTAQGTPSPGTVTTVVCETSTSVQGCPVVTTPPPLVATPPVYRVSTTVGAGMPTSYTFLDTPDANLCVDAFIRIGIDLPPITVSRTLNINQLRQNGLAYTDTSQNVAPILNIVRLNSRYSDVMFQFLNPYAYYCIVYDNATFSNVSIQYNCTSKRTSIEPITVNAVQSTPKVGFFEWIFGSREDAGHMGGTQNSYNSRIQELPCIP